MTYVAYICGSHYISIGRCSCRRKENIKQNPPTHLVYLRVHFWRESWISNHPNFILFFLGGGWLGLDFIKASLIKSIVNLLQGPSWAENWIFLFAWKNSKKILNSFQKWFIFKSSVKCFPFTKIGGMINTEFLRGWRTVNIIQKCLKGPFWSHGEAPRVAYGPPEATDQLYAPVFTPSLQ